MTFQKHPDLWLEIQVCLPITRLGTNLKVLMLSTFLHFQNSSKKYFKRGELLAKEEEEYLKKYRPQVIEDTTTTKSEQNIESNNENSEFIDAYFY